MRKKLILMGLILGVLSLMPFSSGIITKQAVSTSELSSLGSDENFYLNLENSYEDTITWNVSKAPGDTYTFKVRAGRKFIIDGGEVK